jgi:flagellar FliL protein
MRKLLYLLLLCLCLPLAVQAEEEKEQQEQAKPEPLYYEFSPSLVTNLNGGPKYIRCDVQLLVHGEDNKERVAKYAPMLRHELLLMLVEQDGRKLMTLQGKEALRKHAIAVLRQLMQKQTKQAVIEDLYFTSYYVQ